MQCLYRFRGDAMADACTKAEECEWDAKKHECKNTCAYHETKNSDAASQQGDCKADALCDWIPTMPVTQKCQKKCSVLYDEAKACNTDQNGRCMWDAAEKSCKTDCQKLTSSQCMTERTMCVYKFSSTIQCNKRCQFRYNVSDACDADK